MNNKHILTLYITLKYKKIKIKINLNYYITKKYMWVLNNLNIKYAKISKCRGHAFMQYKIPLLYTNISTNAFV